MFILAVIIIIYLAVVSYLGYRGYRNTKNSLDFNVAGRNIHPYIMAMSYGATFISTSAIVGFGGTAAQFGFSLLWLTACNIGVGIFVAFVFFGKRTRRMGLNLEAHTFPEFMGKRLDSVFVQRLMGITIFITMPLYIAAVLIGASRILESLLNINYDVAVMLFTILVAAYVIMGGLKGVMYTDALQGTLMFIGMILLLFSVYINLGGITKAHETLTGLAVHIPEGLKKIGLTGWTTSPVSGSPLWWIVYSSLVMGVGIGVLAQPQLVVRYMTVKSNKEINRAVVIGGLFILAMTGTAFIVGALSNVYFYQTTGKIAMAAAGGNVDVVIPKFIADFMPGWFGYLFMLVILSAGMSTLSSQFHTMGTCIGRDVLSTGKDKSKAVRGREVLVTKLGIVVGLIVTVFLCYRLGGNIIARATAIFFGLMGSSFLAPYAAAIYWRKLTRKGAIAGMATGLIVSLFCFLFLHSAESRVFGLAKLLTGKDALVGGSFAFIDPLVFALPASIIATIVVTLLTKVENPETVEKSFRGIA
jgi:SSS family solute:Na+ symporter